MKILTIIGARPQFIKAATVSRVIMETGGIDEVLVHTGQHFDSNMSDVFFKEMNIPKPNYNLGIGGGNHGEQTGQMLIKIEEVLLKEKPNWVLVYGDTNSTLAGALAAAKLHIPLAHVEAGLRSFNKRMPEEINRILTDHVSDILFTPTLTANTNLSNDGVSKEKVYLVGDVMYDAALFYSDTAKNNSKIIDEVGARPKAFILATVHRAENTDNKEKLLGIFKNLDRVARKHKVLLPLHPRTKVALEKVNYNTDESNVQFIDPVGYMDMVLLEKQSKLIITDSGGVQKEAFFHRVPCLTLRNETEWVELVDNGFNKLVTNFDLLEEEVENSIKNTVFNGEELYGKGDAANKIVKALLEKK